MGKTQDLGKDAETRAEAMLKHRGLRLLARNYRCRGGELDLVMRDREHLVFVEVRYRSHGGYGGAASSLCNNKQRRVLRAAQHNLLANNRSGPYRFDVVAFDQYHEGSCISDALGT